MKVDDRKNLCDKNARGLNNVFKNLLHNKTPIKQIMSQNVRKNTRKFLEKILKILSESVKINVYKN